MHPCSTWHAPAFNRIYRRLVIVSAKQIVDRLRAGFHLLGGRREPGAGRPRADDWRPTFYEPSLPRRGPVAGQQVTQSRLAPPPGSGGRHPIGRCAYLTPEPIHAASPVCRPTCTPWSVSDDQDANRRRRSSRLAADPDVGWVGPHEPEPDQLARQSRTRCVRKSSYPAAMTDAETTVSRYTIKPLGPDTWEAFA
jgi:hypothetical protein